MFRPLSATHRARARPLSTVAAAPVRALVLTMLLAMFLAQCAGLLHAVAHGGAGSAQNTATTPHSKVPALLAASGQSDSGWGHAAGDADCQLWDQLLSQHAACAAMASGKTPGPVAQAIAVSNTAARRHGPVAFYKSRAPPVI